MKAKIISILTVIALLIHMLVPMGSVFAAGTSITLNITGSETTASVGDEIEYTIKGTSSNDLFTLQFYLDIPEGLTYVEGSGKIGSGFDSFDDKSFTANDLGYTYIFVKAEGYKLNNTVLGTFKCKVNDKAKGTNTVGIQKSDVASGVPGFEAYDMEYDEVSSNNVTVNPANTTIAKSVTGVTLNKTAITLEVGKAETLKATVEPEDSSDTSVTWSSSDKSVATVDNNGKVTAVKKGTATITAKTSNDKEATCTVTVAQPITGIKLNKTTLDLEKGGKEKLVATVEPSNADGDKTVTWSSSDTSKVTVTTDGTVTAVEKGSATITAKTSNGKEATCKVTVGVPLKLISLNETSKTLKNGESFTFEVTYNPEDTDAEKAVTWTSSNESVATVDNNGKVTVVSCTGTATITAIATADATKTATATITAAHKDDKLTLHPAKEATCSAEGNKAYYTCSGCDDWYEDETGSVKVTDKESIVIAKDANAHDWDEGKVTTEPDCTKTGVKTYTCKHDSSHKKTEPIPAKGHTMTRHDAKTATCLEDGNIDYYTCSVCNKIFKDETGTTETTLADTVVKALGHDWGEWTTTKEATTEAEGEETRTCKHDSSHVETRAIPKIHVHELTKTEAKDATCSEEGNIEYYTCSVCNKKFSDSEGKTEVDDVVIPVDTNAHDWNEWITTKEATCTEEGSKERTCKNDSTHKETEIIDKKAHTITKVDEVKATCEAQGNIEYYTCSECGKYFEDATATTEITDKTSVITKALGHDWEEWVVSKEATVDEEGLRTRTCKLDGSHVETEVIARIPYAIVDGDNQTHTYEQGEDLEIKANGTLDKLTRLLVDGVELSEDNYTLKSGSTIATLKTSYLDTLSEGEHTLTFDYTDGSVDAKFKVAKVATPDTTNTEAENTSTDETKESTTNKTTTKSSSPKTGDNIMIWISLMIASVLGVIVTAKFMKKKEK